MGRCICYVKDTDDTEYYFLWSTVVDAPVTFGMNLEGFQEFMRYEYGNRGMEDLQQSLERARERGTSWVCGPTFDEMIKFNRAGENESTLSREQLIEWYCRRGENPHC